MEVSEARLQQDQARDSLTKARVTIHSFQPPLVNQDIQAGLTIAAKDLQAGKDALSERDYRRRGLGVAVFFIFITLSWTAFAHPADRRKSGARLKTRRAGGEKSGFPALGLKLESRGSRGRTALG